MNTKGIAAINERYDQLDHDLAQQHDKLLAELSRAFIKVIKQQEPRLDKLDRERNQTSWRNTAKRTGG